MLSKMKCGKKNGGMSGNSKEIVKNVVTMNKALYMDKRTTTNSISGSNSPKNVFASGRQRMKVAEVTHKSHILFLCIIRFSYPIVYFSMTIVSLPQHIEGSYILGGLMIVKPLS